MRKRGISPLIGTVLLIGFTIGLAMIIFVWGSSFTKDLTEQSTQTASKEISCLTGVDIDISRVCYEDNGFSRWIKFTVVNQVSSEVRGFLVSVEDGGVNSVLQSTVVSDLSGFQAKQVLTTSYQGGTSAKLSKVTIVPKIRIKENTVNCGDKNIVFTEVEGC